MKPFQSHHVGFASFVLLVASSFAACGGLDSRKVTRGPATDGVGGEAGPGVGGSSDKGGDTNQNPFGGNLFEGGAPPVLDGPPEVVEVAPADAANDAEPTGSVSLRFSEGLDQATVVADNIQLLDGATQVAGDLSYAGVVATFEPSRRLSLLASYDVSASTGITDSAGVALKQAFASRFTVRDGVWSPQDAVFADQDAWGGEQDLGVDGLGNTLIVWSRRPDVTVSRRTLIGRWYRPTTGWQDEVILADAPTDVTYPKVAVSPEGDAVVAWLQGDSTAGYVTKARRFVGGAWEASAQSVTGLSVDVFNSPSEPSVAIGGGQVVVTWTRVQYNSNPFYIYYNLQLSATTLDGAWPDYPTQNFYATYDSFDSQQLIGPVATVDTSGNAIAVFSFITSNLDPNSGAGVYYVRKATSGSWQYPAKIPGSLAADSRPHVASDGNGAMAVWSRYDSATKTYAVLASRYTKAKQFVAAVPIGDPDLKEYIYPAYGHALVSDGKSFFTSWTQVVGSSRNAYVNRFDIATGTWDAVPTVVSDGAASSGGGTSLGVDSHGNVLTVFEQEAANYQSVLMFARYTSSTATWAAPQLLSAEDNSYHSPFLVVGGNGVATVLFRGGGRQFPGGGGGAYVGGQYRIFK